MTCKHRRLIPFTATSLCLTPFSLLLSGKCQNAATVVKLWDSPRGRQGIGELKITELSDATGHIIIIFHLTFLSQQFEIHRQYKMSSTSCSIVSSGIHLVRALNLVSAVSFLFFLDVIIQTDLFLPSSRLYIIVLHL